MPAVDLGVVRWHGVVAWEVILLWLVVPMLLCSSPIVDAGHIPGRV